MDMLGARWDAKLGLCNFPLGAISTTLLSNIHPDGGAISLIDLVLCRLYPTLYFENGTKRILTESQETFAKRKFERDYEVAMEKILEQRERELIKVNSLHDSPFLCCIIFLRFKTCH